MGQTLLNIILFLVMLGVIITLHEFGHFLIAKFHKVYVYEFSMGMGPKLVQWKGKETKYTIRLFPIGGYCAMAGESYEDNMQITAGEKIPDVPAERTLNHLPWYKQISIMFAGPFMNFILAFVIFVIVFATVGYRVIPSEPVVGEVIADSPAELAGLMADDRIVSIQYADGVVFHPATFEDIVDESAYHDQGKAEIYTIDRNGQSMTFTITPQYDEDSQRYLIGIQALPTKTEALNATGVIQSAASYWGENATLIFRVLGMLLKGKGFDNLSGPVGIYTATSQMIQYGFLNYLALIGILSLNIGIMNLVPIPLFDGGRIVIALIEGILHRPLSERVKNIISYASLALVLALFLLVTYNDIGRLIS